MKNVLKRACSLLMAVAMLMSMSPNIFAAKVTDGNNGETIYFSWAYYTLDEESETYSQVTE